MDIKKTHQQLKQIESLFVPSIGSSPIGVDEVAIIESQRDLNCDIHGGRRGSSGSVVSGVSMIRKDQGYVGQSEQPGFGRKESSSSLRNGFDSTIAPVPITNFNKNEINDYGRKDRESSVTSTTSTVNRRQSFGSNRKLSNESAR